METNAMNMCSEIMICIKLQLVRKAFYEDAANPQLSSGVNQIELNPAKCSKPR